MATILVPSSIITYIAKQTAKGIYAYPTSADAIPDVEVSGSFAQVRTIEDLMRKADSYSVHDYFIAGYEPGKASIKCPIRPGTYPTISGKQLLEATFGKEELNAIEKSANYTLRAPSTEEIWYTIVIKYGVVVVWLFDCLCNSSTMTFAPGNSVDDVFTLSTNYDTLSFAIAGSSTLSESATIGSSTIKVQAPERYTPNAQIKVGTDTTVYTITAVDYSTATLTITPTLAQAGAIDTPVVAYVASPAFPAGSTIWSGLGYFKEEGLNSLILEGSITIEHGTEIVREKADTPYPTQILRGGKRNVTITVNRLATDANSEILLYPFLQKDIALTIEYGSTANCKGVLTIPKARVVESSYDTGTYSGIRLPMTFKALADAGNDEASLKIFMS